MNIVKSILTKNPCYTAGRKITVKGLMLHSVGCSQPNASVFINLWNKESYSTACVHAFIDGNTGIVYQTLPWNHRGWHGGGSSNNTHIGVEMCEPACIKYTGGSTFTCSDVATAKASVKKTYEAAVELFAHLCKEYGLNPLTDIISHKEGYVKGIASNHGDPEHLWKGLNMGYTMDGFRKDVKTAMSGTVVSTEKTENVYRIRKTWSDSKNQIGAFKSLENAKAAWKEGYSIFDQNGKVVYPITTTNTTNAIFEFPTIKTGSMGVAVKMLQAFLEIETDGKFGTITESNVMELQRKNGLTVDGICGKNTWIVIAEKTKADTIC